MRRVIAAAAGTVVGLIMLLSFKTRSAPPVAVAVGPTTSSPATSSPSTDSPTAGSPTAPSPGSGTPNTATGSTSPTTSASATRTVTGAAASTRYGPVQVQITLTGGRVTAVNAVVYPTDTSRDQEINSFAIPRLNQEAVAAKSAKIDMISGATYTSTGYITSLQSALSKAGLA